MKSLRKLYTSVLMLLLLFAGASQALAADAVDDLKGKYISQLGGTWSNVSSGQWYYIRSYSSDKYTLKDLGTGTSTTGGSVTASTDAVENAGQLFYVEKSGSNYTIKSGYGNYLSLKASVNGINFSTQSSEVAINNRFSWFTYYTIKSTDQSNNQNRFLYLNGSNIVSGLSSSSNPGNNYYFYFCEVTLANKGTLNFGANNIGTISVDQTSTINAWNIPSGATVSYVSADPSVATVSSSGVVTGVGVGSTTISIIVAETATTLETTKDITVSVTRINLSQTPTVTLSPTSIETGQTAKMTVTTVHDGTIAYTSSNTSVATVNANGIVKGVGEGTATISYSIGQSNKYNAYSGSGKQITVTQATGLTGVYYIMDKATGKFLTRGKNYGYQSMVGPYGLPWYLVFQGNDTYTMYMYDMYKQGVTTKALGTNGYADNTSPVNWTIAGTQEECTIAYNGKYIAINSDETIAPQSSTANKWVLLSVEEYEQKILDLQEAQELSVAESQYNINLGTSSLTAFLAANNFEEQDMTSQLESQPAEGGAWTCTKANGSALNFGTYGAELYQANGSFVQQVTGLTPGIYKVRIKALKRAGSNATSLSIGNEGYPLSDAYLTANGQTVCVKDWYSGRAGDANPNTTTQFVTRVEAGKYASDVYTTVGSDGILDLKVVSEAYQSSTWFCFHSVELTYYKDTRREPSTLTISPSSLSLIAGASANVTLDFGEWDGKASSITHTTPTATIATITGSGTSYTVKAVGKGETKVTFTLPETNKYRSTTAELTINVGVAATNLAFAVTSVEVPIDGTTTNLATTTSASSGSITYSSSNETVASVNSLTGLVTAKKLGTATITATLAGNNQFASATASYSLNVIRKQTTLQFKNVVNNTLSKVWGQEVTEGDTFNNAATTNSTSTIQYSSDNFEVVTVDSKGTITFHGVGTATITASVAQNDIYQAAEARCFVYVTDQNYYRLTLVNAPSRGVLITIGSKTFTEDAEFTSTGEITASMVKVATVSSYTSSVNVEMQATDNSATNPHIITVTYTLIPPTAGRFYRISSYNNHTFLSDKVSNVSGHANNLALTQIQDQQVIVYIDNNSHALFYDNGQYMNASGQLVAVGGGTGAVLSFSSTDAMNEGAFAIKAGSLYLRDENSYVSFDSKSVTGATDWSFEQVNSLPVTLSSAGLGYGTLFCPVALQVPGGISAFSIEQMATPTSTVDRDYTLKLERIVSIIPANTPVVIQGMPGATYEFPILYSNSDAALSSAPGVSGSAPSLLTSSQETSGTVFTLQLTTGSTGVGFYPWKSTNTSGRYPQNVIQGFRTYIVYGGSGINSFHLQVDDEEGNTNSIESVEEAGTQDAYDMLGRKVEQGTKGLMMQQGRKVLVR